jgi:hypothetical protein
MASSGHQPRRIAVSRAQRLDSPADIARPFLWVAAISFTAGFWGYLALSPLLAR